MIREALELTSTWTKQNATSVILSHFCRFPSSRYPQFSASLRDGYSVVLVRASLCPALISIVGYRGIVRFTGCIRVNVLLPEALYPIPLGAFGWIHSGPAVLCANFFSDASRWTVSLIPCVVPCSARRTDTECSEGYFSSYL